MLALLLLADGSDARATFAPLVITKLFLTELTAYYYSTLSYRVFNNCFQ